MVTLELIETGSFLELSEPEITYIMQAADFADLTKANASFSHSFTAPKTPHNTGIMENLGIKGDTSGAPYRRLYCRLLDNGTPVIDRGLLDIRETAENYRMHIKAGIVEFFHDVSNATIGEEIDLSDLAHENTLATILESFHKNTGYKYILANYGGPLSAQPDGTVDFPVNSLVPAVNVGWLIDRIFQAYGWTYEGIDFSDQWLTYPTAPAYNEENSLEVIRMESPSGINYREEGFLAEFNQGYEYFSKGYAALQTPTELVIERPGPYVISWELERNDNFSRATGGIILNGERTFARPSPYRSDEVTETNTAARTGSVTLDLNRGDVISLFFGADLYQGIDQWERAGRAYLSSALSVRAMGVETIDFKEALIKYKIKDFFKEIMIRAAAAPFVDTELKHIVFRTLDQRSAAGVIDWSGKYIGREKEAYTFRNYARNNYLKHKYDDETENRHDGNLRVPNENLEAEKDLFQSQTYAPDAEITTLRTREGTIYTNPLRMFEAQPKEGGEIEYKELNDRFFFLRETWQDQTVYIGGSEVRGFPFVNMENTTFSQIVSKKYTKAREILSGTRVHTFNLALTKYDVTNVDLSARYYFEQEGAVYIINRLTWKTGGMATGEFVKLNI